MAEINIVCLLEHRFAILILRLDPINLEQIGVGDTNHGFDSLRM